MKKILVIGALLFSCTAAFSQEPITAAQSRKTMSRTSVVIADETTATVLKETVKVVSSNPSIAIGLMAKVDPGVTKYMVERKKTETMRYLQYTIWIEKPYTQQIQKYFDSLNVNVPFTARK